MEVISVREHPQWLERTIAYFQEHWAGDESRMVYDNCIRSCIGAAAVLPQWYLLYDAESDAVAGCAGLITNDFISRMDLYPWVCALYIEPQYRGRALGSVLLERAKQDARKGGFSALYLCTDHVGYYEHYGFSYIADGYHPWGESSRIYETKLQ